MKQILLLAAAACVSVAAMAIPAKPGFVTFTQPDGTEVQIKLVGDEHGHVAYTSDGLVVVNVDGRLEYASFDESGIARASGKVVTSFNMDREEARRLQTSAQIDRWAEILTANRDSKIALHDSRFKMSTRSEDSSDGESTEETPGDDENSNEGEERVVPLNFGRCTSSFPVLGEQKGLVILVEYDDVKFEYGDYEYFNRMLNEEGFSDHGSLGSARDWFIENSGGKFLPDFDVFGPVTLPNKRKYYGGNDVYGSDKRAHEMVIHACDSLDGKVDFTQYDRDGDGKIDNVFVFYAGKGEHDSNIANAVWPHSWEISVAEPDTTYIYDGVVLDHYACTCEYPSGYKRPDGIGTFVHEFSHVMGLPDLYVTTYTSGFTPGAWSVLDQGPYNNDRLTPPNYSSYEKTALGWIDMLPMEEGPLELEDFTSTNKAYVLPTERKNEFYFFENRQQIGNDAYLPYHGMLVWRVDYSKNHWDMNTVNNTASHQRVDLIEADNKKTEATRKGDPFPGIDNITEFTFETAPKLESWSKKELAFDIKNIVETEDGLITFDAVSRPKEIEPDPGAVSIVEADGENLVIYDLIGRRVKNLSNGIYIVNGKKVVVGK
ncbi:MAG: M6 family metalloprotease domain-containing protein [Muribaculum sp.]|nr:M6 family metalloprotease domain-containing protein [Muribaculum sp.]